MICATTATTIITDSYEEPLLGAATINNGLRSELRRRRYSSYHREPWLEHEVENIQLLVSALQLC